MMRIQENVSLLKCNTFKIEAKAKYFAEVKSVEDIYELIKNSVFQDNKRFILGGGSNILLTGDYDGIVIKNGILGKEILRKDGKIERLKDENIIGVGSEINNSGLETVYVRAGAGENWHSFVFWCVQNGYGGLENLISIPGTVGASPIQNIGAYGVEVKDCIDSVEGVKLKSGKVEKLKSGKLNFGYRDSIFKHELKDEFIVTNVVFKLKRIDQHYKFNLGYKDITNKMNELGISESELTIKKLIDIIVSLRIGKLPNWYEIGTAGSFFKNPTIKKTDFEILKARYPDISGYENFDGVKLSAGRLIEKTGFKGVKFGDVGVRPGHALILVNYGGGTGKEIVNLVNRIVNKVKEMFNVTLEPEVNYI